MELQSGDMVWHSKFGYGDVLEITPDDDCIVAFDIHGRTVIRGSHYLYPAAGLDNLRRERRRPVIGVGGSLTAGSPDREPTLGELAAIDLSVRRMSIDSNLYRHWVNHDLNSGRPLYANLPQHDRPWVWRFIESRYLRQYRVCLRVEFAPCSSGLWQIYFPGGQAFVPDGDRDPAVYGAPAWLNQALESWSEYAENTEFDWQHDGGCEPDWAEIDAEGLALARQLKRYAAADCYVEYHYFQEIRLIDGQPVQLPVPTRISRYSEPARPGRA